MRYVLTVRSRRTSNTLPAESSVGDLDASGVLYEALQHNVPLGAAMLASLLDGETVEYGRHVLTVQEDTAAEEGEMISSSDRVNLRDLPNIG